MVVPKVKNLVDIDSIDLIVSPAMGGVIVGYELSRHLNKLNIFAERKDGVFSIRRGFKINKGQKVLVVEDIVTTGKSSLECFECINELGGEIVAEAALINRGGDSVNLGVPLITLANLDIPNYEPENLPEDLKIFLIIFFVSDGSFSIIDIAFAIAPRLPFFKSVSKANAMW